MVIGPADKPLLPAVTVMFSPIVLELYAIAFWKAYKVWPRANNAMKCSKPELVMAISELSDKIKENDYVNE